ncbi:MAG: hypothetical protein HDR49_00930 [Bacteroides sp.]|nr:hypothetical protein [Bacteroides sp.]
MRIDFYENRINSIAEDISSGKIDLQSLSYDKLFRLFSLCAEIARTYGGGFWADYSHTTVQYYYGIAELSPWILQNSTNPFDRILGLMLSARRGDENARARLNALSDEMLEAFDKAVKVGLQYVSDNGCYVALACYATGNVELGLIVDGIVIVCKVMQAFYEYMETGDYGKYLSDCISIALNIWETKMVGNTLERYNAPLSSEFSEKINNCLNESQGAVFGALTDAIIEKMSNESKKDKEIK